MYRIPALIQNLSLDVTAGAVVSSAFVCQYFQVRADWHMMLGLAIAIWLIYTVDHLRDALKADDQTINPRHTFHKRNYKQVLVLAVLILIIGVLNAFWLPLSTIWYGLGLGGFSGLYFAYLKLSHEQTCKELFAAIIYSLGIFAAPLSLLDTWHPHYIIFFLLFFLLVTANLVLFPLYEMEIDQHGGMRSIALKRGEKRASLLVRVLLLLHAVLLVIAILWLSDFYAQAVTFAIMNLTLTLLIINRQSFRKYQSYRWLGDGIFLMPIVPVLIIG